MCDDTSDRITALDAVRTDIDAAQDTLTHLWVSMLAVEQTDADRSATHAQRHAVYVELCERATTVHTTLDAFRATFAAWALHVEQQHFEAARGLDILEETFRE